MFRTTQCRLSMRYLPCYWGAYWIFWTAFLVSYSIRWLAEAPEHICLVTRLISDKERDMNLRSEFPYFLFRISFLLFYRVPDSYLWLDRWHDYLSRYRRLCQPGSDGRVHVFHLDHPCPIGIFAWRFGISWCEWEHDDRGRGKCFLQFSLYIDSMSCIAFSLSFMLWLRL